jgi:hypothetical protein
MATHNYLDTASAKAASDLSAKQYYAVKLTAADTVDAIAAATDRVAGILVNKPKQGQAATVVTAGVCECVSNGGGTAIAVGDLVGPDATGKMVKKATADFNACGVAHDASTADGVIIRVRLNLDTLFRAALG